MASFSLVVRMLLAVLWIEVVASFSAPSTSQTASASRDSIASSLPQIPRIPAPEFDPNLQYYHTIKSKSGNIVVYETPVIVEGVLSENACEKLTDDLVSECGSIEVTLQRKRREKRTPSPSKRKSSKNSKRDRRKSRSKKNDNNEEKDTDDGAINASTTDMYLCSFLESIDLVLGQSNHNDALLAFCEGLLDPKLDTMEDNITQKDLSSSPLSLQQKMEEVREKLFQQRSPMNLANDTNKCDTYAESTSSSHPIDPCWFRDYFPTEASPTDCVILAGEGATSTLHRDPLEWTGTNLCLDGTKVWRFVAPPLAVAAVKATREKEELAFEANGDEDGSSSVALIDGLLDAYRLDSIAWGNDEDEENPLTLSAGWQSDYSLFANFYDRISSSDLMELEEKEGNQEKLDTISRIASDADRLQPNIPVGIAGASTGAKGAKHSQERVTLWSGVQKAGDMIVIPAHWWHQTYAMEASLAIASQRCGAHRDSERVIRHILETTAAATALTTESAESDEAVAERTKILSSLRSKSSSPQEIVSHLFDYLTTLKAERRV